MQTSQFNRDEMADWYAHEHLKVDPGVQKIYYLGDNAPAREIRFLEINTLLAERTDDALEPIDFRVDVGSEVEHKLLVLDVTPSQWQSIGRGTLTLPEEWSLNNAKVYQTA